MAIPAAAGIAAGASAIGLYILQRAWGFVTGLLEAEAVEKLNEARADGPEAFDNVAGELAELERAGADYEAAFQNARLKAHALLLAEGPQPRRRAIPACDSYRHMPEMQQLQAAAEKLRELDRHSDALAAETIMNMEAELQILQDQMEQDFDFWSNTERRQEAAARYDRNTVRIANARSVEQGFVKAWKVNERTEKLHITSARSREIDARISDLIGRLEYIVETIQRDSETFVALDERICSKYRIHGQQP